jgi:hypothetical protein
VSDWAPAPRLPLASLTPPNLPHRHRSLPCPPRFRSVPFRSFPFLSFPFRCIGPGALAACRCIGPVLWLHAGALARCFGCMPVHWPGALAACRSVHPAQHRGAGAGWRAAQDMVHLGRGQGRGPPGGNAHHWWGAAGTSRLSLRRCTRTTASSVHCILQCVVLHWCCRMTTCYMCAGKSVAAVTCRRWGCGTLEARLLLLTTTTNY